ncbi:NAD(P)-dependent oxidoreductase [Deltaproteobacteria bacterium TL4]
MSSRKKLLITGASGFLGWNLCHALSADWELYGTLFRQQMHIPGTTLLRTDLSQYPELKQLFLTIKPDAVIHTAALAKPGYCQEFPEESYKLNVEASTQIAGLCADLQIPCIFTSSDLVFDGKNPPYEETAPPCPVNRYGAQKVLAEEKMRATYPSTMICRMALMFGPSGPKATSILQPMLKAMAQGEKLHLFEDEFRSPLSAEAAVSGLVIALNSQQGGILHLGGYESISRFDFGKIVASVFQEKNANLVRCKQADVPTIAPRSSNVSFDSSKAMSLGFAPLPLTQELMKIYRHGPHKC